MRAKAEASREWVRTMSRWRNARTARAYSGRRVAAIAVLFFCGDAGGDEDCDDGFVVATLRGIKGVDGTVGDIVIVVVGILNVDEYTPHPDIIIHM
jgi:hypothetical protein